MSIECFPDLSAKRRRRFLLANPQNDTIFNTASPLPGIHQADHQLTKSPHLAAALSKGHQKSKSHELEGLLLKDTLAEGLPKVNLMKKEKDVGCNSILSSLLSAKSAL
jgi:hypothetical protein